MHKDKNLYNAPTSTQPKHFSVTCVNETSLCTLFIHIHVKIILYNKNFCGFHCPKNL